MNKLQTIILASTLAVASASLCPTSAFADKGSGHGSGGGGSNGSASSGSSGSSTSGSSDDHSGNTSNNESEAGDDNGRDRNNDKDARSKDADHAFEAGWRERLRAGQYELFDPEGRLVVRRDATRSDVKRFK